MATVKKRRLEEEDAATELSRMGDGPVGPQLPPHLREQPADPQAQHIAQLEGKLKHLRGWMKAIQDQMQANIVHRDTVFNARRLFVGGVPPGTSDDELCRFLGNAIINTGASVSSTGRPVTYCRIQRDKNFAFVEVRSAEEASNCMALDGLVFKDAPLKIKRPSKYDPAASFALGPTDPDPSMDLSQVTISTPPAALATVSDLPPGKYEATNNTLYVGGLPIEWTNEQCMELLKMYGEVKYFRLMIDRQTGNSRGFAFAEYTTDEATNAALAALDGAQLGPRRIAANRMLEHKQKQQQQQMQQQGMWQGQGQGQGQMGGAGNIGGWGGRQDGFGGSGGRGPGMGGGGMQQGPAGGMGGMMGQQGGMMPPTPMPGAGMQQQGGYGYDGMGGGYGMGAQMQQQQQMPQQQQGLANQLAVGGGMGMGAMGVMPAAAAAAGGGMQEMGPSQQGMYGMNQPAAAAGGGYDASYGGQMQSGGGMYGGQQQQQPGMGMGAAGMPMGGMGAADGYAQQYGMAGGYGQQYDQQQQMQQPGYGAAAGGMGGAPPMGAGGGGMGGAGAMAGPGGQMGGMQGPAGGMGGIQQPVPPPRRPDQVPLTIKTEQPASGPPSTGIGGAMGGWQAQPQAAWSGTGGQQMHNW